MRFDVYKMPKGGKPGYLLDVQADLVEELKTRIVVPLYADARLPVIFKNLNPWFDVLGDRVVMMTQELASIEKRHLRRPVASIAQCREEITRALDLLFTGF